MPIQLSNDPAGRRRSAATMFCSALLAVVLTACGSDSTAETADASATNDDGTPAAELVSPNSRSIDDIRLANERIAECARSAGLDATVDATGEGVEVVSGGDQTGPVEEIMERCQEDHAFPEFEYTEQEMRALYEATVRQANCIEDVVGLDLAEPPSAEVWIESQGGAWSPLVELGDALRVGDRTTGGAMESEALEACPTPR